MKEAHEHRLFNQLFTDYYQRFIRFADSYVRNPSIAEDITTEAFTVFWEHLKTLPEGTNYPAYLITIVRNSCLSFLRKKAFRLERQEDIKEYVRWDLQLQIDTLEACQPQKLFTKEIRQIISKALDVLSACTATVFHLNRQQNLSHREIAKQLKITEKGVEFHITKALKLIRKRMKDYLR